MSDHTASDGSPLAVYLALPAGDAPLTIHRAIGTESSILELGSGPGRLTRVLVALGHRVTAVDDSAEMLAHVTGASTTCADLFDLAIDERFDVVLAASHLLNVGDPEQRRSLLRVCAGHVAVDGQVIMERYPPGWLRSTGSTVGQVGPVTIEFRPGEIDGDRRSAAVTYRLAERSWSQEFIAADVDDDQLRTEAKAVGLELAGSVDEMGAWVRLVPARE